MGDRRDAAVQDASALVLRAGVLSSVAVMLAGVARTLQAEHVTLLELQQRRFHAGFAEIARGCLRGDGPALVELGILLLVATPIARVAASMAVFAFEERDWLYTALTAAVLGLTLGSLLLGR